MPKQEKGQLKRKRSKNPTGLVSKLKAIAGLKAEGLIACRFHPDRPPETLKILAALAASEPKNVDFRRVLLTRDGLAIQRGDVVLVFPLTAIISLAESLEPGLAPAKEPNRE